jgi:hypothetical protein
VFAVLVIAGCGGDDGDGDSAADPTTASPDVAVFDGPEVGFTFEYPKEFAAQTAPRRQVLGQVSVEPNARFNAIKIRQTAEQELETDRYLDEFQRDFSRTVGKVEKRKETIGELQAGVLSFDDSVKGTRFTSTSYFFTGGGGTWQVECIADTQHRSEIDDACMAALESIEFKS